MSKLIDRLRERILEGPRCPACNHFMNLRGQTVCLGSVRDEHDNHVRWCECTHTAKPARRRLVAAVRRG